MTTHELPQASMDKYLTLTTAFMAITPVRKSKEEERDGSSQLTPLSWPSPGNGMDQEDQRPFYSPIRYNLGDHLSWVDKCQDLVYYREHIGKCKGCKQKPQSFEELFGYHLDTNKMDKPRGGWNKISKFGKRLYSWLKSN